MIVSQHRTCLAASLPCPGRPPVRLAVSLRPRATRAILPSRSVTHSAAGSHQIASHLMPLTSRLIIPSHHISSHVISHHLISEATLSRTYTHRT